MRRFKSAQHAQRFVETHGIIASHFRPRRILRNSTQGIAEVLTTDIHFRLTVCSNQHIGNVTGAPHSRAGKLRATLA